MGHRPRECAEPAVRYRHGRLVFPGLRNLRAGDRRFLQNARGTGGPETGPGGLGQEHVPRHGGGAGTGTGRQSTANEGMVGHQRKSILQNRQSPVQQRKTNQQTGT